MSNKNQQRGKGAERRICSALSSILEVEFIRMPGSGSGNAWKIFKGTPVRGDVICPDKDFYFPFMVESKKTGKKFSWDLFFTGSPPADFNNWWQKAKDDGTADGKFAVLVISRNQGPMVCFTSNVAWQVLKMDVKYAPVRMLYEGKLLLITPVEWFATAFKRRSK